MAEPQLSVRSAPNPAVIAWLVRNDAELALPTVTIAEIAYCRPGEGRDPLLRLSEIYKHWRLRTRQPPLMPPKPGPRLAAGVTSGQAASAILAQPFAIPPCSA